MTLAHLSDEELLSNLTAVCFESRRLLGRLLLYLVEVEERRLDLRSACSSLYDFCLRRLGMSESEAVRRIEAARLIKRFPRLLDAIEQGDIHLTALLLLREHFTEDNVVALVEAARGKTKRELAELLAARAPKSDVMATLTELPAAPPTSSATLSTSSPASPSPAHALHARLEPLSPTRHRLELTISTDLRAKLDRARDLMGHRIPDARLEDVLDSALDALLAKLDKERLAKTTRPHRTARSTKPGCIARSVRREVFARDGDRCTFTDADGNRCGSRTRLELDHVVPRALGGTDDAPNLQVVCRPHNRLRAEQSFGREYVESRIHIRQRRSKDTVLDVAERALTKMGFRSLEVRRVLVGIHPPGACGPAPPIAEVIRSALGLLTA